MNVTGIDSLDHTIQDTNVWLKAIMHKLETDDRYLAFAALRGALHALRDRIGPENAVHLGAQLPTLIRGIYYAGWHMAGTPTRERHKQQFLEHIGRETGRDKDLDLEGLACAVFDVMWEKLDPGETAKLINMLPKELHELWPRAAWGE